MSLAHLGHAIRNDKSSGKPLKTVWKSLHSAGLVFRQGETSIVGAGSGTGKSVFSLTLALRSGAKTIYFSADSGPSTQLTRAASMITGKDVRDCRTDLEKGYFFDNELIEAKHIRWEFDAGPSLDDIYESLDAYGYLHGEYPELVIVDNLMNVIGDDTGEGAHKNEENTLMIISDLAKRTGCHSQVLTHLVGDYADGNKPAPMSALRNKVDKSAEVVLTLHRIEETDQLGVFIAKNRNDVRGTTVELDLDLSKMLVTDPASMMDSVIPR